ncbi:protein CFAP20DC [Fundulus diaphanus]
MFRNNYQGGAVFDLFSGQGKDPVAKWKLCGGPSAIHKEYNKEVKGFVYCLEGSSHTVKMQMPENAKMSLGLIQRFLVLQVNVPERHDFSTELVITDLEHLKRRLYFSTVHKEMSATLLHAKIPFTELKRNIWSTLCIDLASLASELFKGFLTLDGITLFATCKIRRIFTMKTDPKVMPDIFLSGACLREMIPRSFWYPSDVNQITHVLNYDILQKAEVKSDPLSSASVHDQSPTATSTSYRRTKPQGVLQTASGSRASSASPKTGRTSRANLDRMERSVWNSWESNEGSEPQLTLQEEVFTFSSQPHSPKRGQSQGDQEKMELGDGQVQSAVGGRRDAQPEDDFIGSESDEDMSHVIFHHPKTSMVHPATRRSDDTDHLENPPESPNTIRASPKLDSTNTCVQSPCSGRAEPTRMVPAHCLSPSRRSRRPEEVDQVSGENLSVSLCRRLLHEVHFSDSKQRKEEDEILRTVESSNYVSQLHGNTRMCEDDEELRMLASLKRQQDEDECRAPALSASHIHQCDVSTSLSSDDASTWTRIPHAVNQGHHYQKEMNPLLQSNPREWMDVLSPPIMPPSQQRRSGKTENNLESLLRGGDGLVKEEENEDEYLKLLYDTCLNCYFDPESGKYYELACASLGGRGNRMSTQQAGLRLHPGIIASVILVCAAAVAAAVLIIRKYCFPVNEATYRYSLLRRMEDQESAVTEEDGDRGPSTVGEESDEELLE